MLITIHAEGRKPFAMNFPSGAWSLIEDYARDCGVSAPQFIAQNFAGLARCAREQHGVRNQYQEDPVYRALLDSEERVPAIAGCAGMEVVQ